MVQDSTQHATHRETAPTWSRVTEWLLGIVGLVAAFVGLFILLAGEDQSIGFGGDLAWRVGEIDPAWGYGLALGGALLLLISLILLVFVRSAPASGVSRVDRPGRELLGHAAIFAVVNALLWAQDAAAGGGIEYAYWVTIPWGIGLVVHATLYLVGERGAADASGEGG